MKKKLGIMAGVAAGVVLLGGTLVFAVNSAGRQKVKVISVSELSGYAGGMGYWSTSGNITSDVSQNIYLADSQTVQEIFVKEGDTVKEGDPLISYDMTLTNLELEMKRLDRQGIELNIRKASEDIKKLKNTKPVQENGDGDFSDPGIWEELPGEELPDVPEEPDIPQEVPETEALGILDGKAIPYMGEGTLENPYHFLCSQEGRIQGSFFNAMAQQGCFFVIEVRQGDVSTGELMKIWGQKISNPEETFDPEAEYILDLGIRAEEEEIRYPDAFSQLTGDHVTGEKWCTGKGTEKQPYIFLVTADGSVTGSFFNRIKEAGAFFRIEVRSGNTWKGILEKAWEQNGTVLADSEEDALYLVHLDAGKKPEPSPEPTQEPSPEPTQEPSPEPTQEPGPQPTQEPGPQPDQEPAAGEDQENSQIQTSVMGAQTYRLQPMTVGRTNTTIWETVDTGGSADKKTVSSMMNSVGSIADGAMTAEEIQRQIKEKEKEIRGYQLDLKEADLNIASIEKTLSNQTIKSTLNGVVKSVEDPAKKTNGKPLIQVVSSEGLYIQGTIGEMQLDKLQPGQILNGYSYDNGVSFTAQVKEISPYPVDNSGSPQDSQYPFTAYIENAEGLNNHAYAELTIAESGMDVGAITLEKAFVRAEEGQYYVMKENEKGRLEKQPVQIARVVNGAYELQGGISYEDKIAFPYGKQVVEGAVCEDGTREDLYR